MARLLFLACALFLPCAIVSPITAQANENKGSDVPEPLADGRLIKSPSDFVGVLSQLKLIAGYASNASLTAPPEGFKYVQCAVSYGTWILQIQAETERAFSKATTDRRRVRTELEGVKRSLYGLLGVRDAEKRMSIEERRRSIARYQEEVEDNLRKAVTAAGDAHSALSTPKLMLEEMETALPTQEANSMDETYCQNGNTQTGGPRPQQQSARHRKKAIGLLKQARQHWGSAIELHKYIEQRVARDIDQGEKPILQHRVDSFLKDERSTAQQFETIIAPIVQRMLKNISILKAIEDAYAAQNIVQRYAKLPIISARRNDTEICREYNRMADEIISYDQKARETLIKSMGQQ